MKKIVREEKESEVLYVDFNVTYTQESYIEEGHGFHEFIDEQEIDRKISKAYIELKNGIVIDITDRLTREEKKHIIDYNERI
jgi:hypothetical protein